MSEQEKDKLTCDQVFTFYLADVAKKVNHQYFRVVMKFVVLYRECLNEQGWKIRREHIIKAGIRLKDDK